MFMCHSRGFSPKKSAWIGLGVLVLLLQENSGQIMVTQAPSVVVSRLNENATLPCRFSHTPEQRVSGVILYWYWTGPKGEDQYAYPPNQALPQYKGRVVALGRTASYENSSVLLLNVSWTDSHRFHCMLSYEKAEEPERKRGKGVLLLLHDSMTFQCVPEKVSVLWCSVNVSLDPGFRLSVLRDGVQVDGEGQNRTHSPLVTLSFLVPLHYGAEYECRLYHSTSLLVSKTFSAPELAEPVFLYIAILLVPFTVLVIFLTALLYMKSKR